MVNTIVHITMSSPSYGWEKDHSIQEECGNQCYPKWLMRAIEPWVSRWAALHTRFQPSVISLHFGTENCNIKRENKLWVAALECTHFFLRDSRCTARISEHHTCSIIVRCTLPIVLFTIVADKIEVAKKFIQVGIQSVAPRLGLLQHRTEIHWLANSMRIVMGDRRNL